MNNVKLQDLIDIYCLLEETLEANDERLAGLVNQKLNMLLLDVDNLIKGGTNQVEDHP